LEQQGMVMIEVRDNGCDMDDPERIFEPFFTTKPTGLGVGLSICRSIIEAHGGRLWARANERYGAILAFTLPTAEVPRSVSTPAVDFSARRSGNRGKP
jgi:signal transduction histidine kinase